MTSPRSLFAIAPLVLMMIAPSVAYAQAEKPLPPRTDQEAAGMLVFIGTYTGEKTKSQGIYALRMDPKTGALTPPQLAGEAKNPSYLALHPGRRYLYAACEVWDA